MHPSGACHIRARTRSGSRSWGGHSWDVRKLRDLDHASAVMTTHRPQRGNPARNPMQGTARNRQEGAARGAGRGVGRGPCRIAPYWIKAAPLRSAEADHARTGLRTSGRPGAAGRPSCARSDLEHQSLEFVVESHACIFPPCQGYQRQRGRWRAVPRWRLSAIGLALSRDQWRQHRAETPSGLSAGSPLQRCRPLGR